MFTPVRRRQQRLELKRHRRLQGRSTPTRNAAVSTGSGKSQPGCVIRKRGMKRAAAGRGEEMGRGSCGGGRCPCPAGHVGRGRAACVWNRRGRRTSQLSLTSCSAITVPSPLLSSTAGSPPPGSSLRGPPSPSSHTRDVQAPSSRSGTQPGFLGRTSNRAGLRSGPGSDTRVLHLCVGT